MERERWTERELTEWRADISRIGVKMDKEISSNDGGERSQRWTSRDDTTGQDGQKHMSRSAWSNWNWNSEGDDRKPNTSTCGRRGPGSRERVTRMDSNWRMDSTSNSDWRMDSNSNSNWRRDVRSDSSWRDSGGESRWTDDVRSLDACSAGPPLRHANNHQHHISNISNNSNSHSGPSRSIYIKNILQGTPREEIKALVCSLRGFEHLTMKPSHGSHQKDTAFVRFSQVAYAQDAINTLQGRRIKGLPLIVQFAWKTGARVEAPTECPEEGGVKHEVLTCPRGHIKRVLLAAERDGLVLSNKTFTMLLRTVRENCQVVDGQGERRTRGGLLGRGRQGWANAELQAAANDTCDKAMEIVHTMTQIGIEPDNFIYSALLSILRIHNRWRDAIGCWHKMHRVPITPDLHTCNAMLRCLSTAAPCDQAESMWHIDHVLQEMNHLGLQPDAFTFTSLAKTTGNVRDGLLAYEAKGGTRTVGCICLLISDAAQHADYQAALTWLDTAVDLATDQLAGLDPTAPQSAQVRADLVRSFNASMDACKRGHQWELALEVWYRLLASPLAHPSKVSYAVIIQTLADCKQYEAAFEMIKDLQSDANVNTNDEVLVNAMIDALQPTKPGEARALFDRAALEMNLFGTFHYQRFEQCILDVHEMGHHTAIVALEFWMQQVLLPLVDAPLGGSLSIHDSLYVQKPGMEAHVVTGRGLHRGSDQNYRGDPLYVVVLNHLKSMCPTWNPEVASGRVVLQLPKNS